MPAIWKGHPRYTAFIFLALVATFFLLRQSPPALNVMADSLHARLQNAERLYQNVLHRRANLIKKHGPTPKDIAMFPPNVEPWPPYTAWDFFPASFNCPHEVQRIGALGDGGKWVCGLSRLKEKPDCVVYSFGINLESSFEAEILENTRHCQIWGYDFSVESFGPEIHKIHQDRTHFFAYKLGGEDKHDPEEKTKMYTLETLMKMNGHTHIDILKVDIEGHEYRALTTFIQSSLSSRQPLPFAQLQVELHAWKMEFHQLLSFFEMLESVGLRPFMTEPNLVYTNYNPGKGIDLAEYSFINIRSDNIFIRDPPKIDAGRSDRPVRHGPRPT